MNLLAQDHVYKLNPGSYSLIYVIKKKFLLWVSSQWPIGWSPVGAGGWRGKLIYRAFACLFGNMQADFRFSSRVAKTDSADSCWLLAEIWTCLLRTGEWWCTCIFQGCGHVQAAWSGGHETDARTKELETHSLSHYF